MSQNTTRGGARPSRVPGRGGPISGRGSRGRAGRPTPASRPTSAPPRPVPARRATRRGGGLGPSTGVGAARAGVGSAVAGRAGREAAFATTSHGARGTVGRAPSWPDGGSPTGVVLKAEDTPVTSGFSGLYGAGVATCGVAPRREVTGGPVPRARNRIMRETRPREWRGG